MSDQVECWGPYRSSVEARLASCEDFIGRLRRSIDGEIAPDRFYFGDKAHELRDAAQSLVDHVDDIEWWLGACDERIEQTDPQTGAVSAVECGLVATHVGAHRADGDCAEQRVLAEVRSAARALRGATDRLAWGLLTLRADAGITNPLSLADELRRVQVRLVRAASSLVELGSSESVARSAR